MLLGYIKLNRQDFVDFELGDCPSHLPWCDPCLLVSWVEDPTGCEGVGGAGVGHAFTRVVRSFRWGKKHRTVIKRPQIWDALHWCSSACPHPWRPCCWGGATVMEKAGKAELERARAARGWSRRCWRRRGRRVWQRRRRWADSGSIVPLVHPPPSLPIDKPGDTTAWRHSCVTNVSV